jgi:poly-beta-1,6-N-acetyl-D-glucosamine synthase
MLFAIMVLWVALLLPPTTYYIWMLKNRHKRSFITNDGYKPNVTLIIATYNERAVIEKKLENIQELDYPENALQVIVVDSASNDGTLEVCKSFLAGHKSRFPITLISEKERLGKSHALNFALKHSDGDIIATSDADSFWENDALRKAISYFADPSIGAVTGREKLSNIQKSINTLSEGLYRGFYYTLRLGESNIHSTLIVQGELALYRRKAFVEFENRPGYSDDIGTVINIVSNGYRCIFVPEAVFYDTAAFSLKGRLMLKSRRAEHLIAGVVRSLKLKMNGKLPLSSVVVFFNFYFHVISPFLLIIAVLATIAIYLVDFRFLWYFGIFLVPVLVLQKPRIFAFSYLTSNIALMMGLFHHITRKQSATWPKIDEMRLKK